MPLRPEEIHIESSRLSIRPFSANDADATFPCITPSLTRWMSWEPPTDREDFDRIWRSWLPAIAEGTDLVFAVRRRDSGSFVGLVGLHHVQNASAELGIWIREDRHREGIGREAVGLVAGWASSVLGIERFTYPVAEENYPSRRIAESLGGVVAERRETPKYKSVVYQIPGQLKLTPMSEGTVDRLALFALYKLSLHEYIDQSFGWDDDFQQERFNTSYRDPEFTLITLGSVAAGYFALRNEGEAVHLSLMLMKPEFRNRGIGRKVMQTLMSRTAESNQPLTLSCFLGNQAAMSFYQKLGFRAVKKDEHFVTYQSPAPD